MSKHTTTTAALKATTVDTRLLDAKIIKLDGTNIEDLIKNSSIKIEDGRTNPTNRDIWEHAAVQNEDGSVTVKNLHCPDASGWSYENIGGVVGEGYEGEIITQFVPSRVCPVSYYGEDSEAWTEDDIPYMEPGKKLKVVDFDGTSFGEESYEYCNMDLSKVVDGSDLFSIVFPHDVELPVFRLYNTTFSNLEHASYMVNNSCEDYYHYSRFIVRLSDVSFPKLNDGTSMFETNNIELYNVSFPNLNVGTCMFYGCNCQFSGEIDFPSLAIGDSMFFYAKSNILDELKYRNVNLSRLTDGSMMFEGMLLPDDYPPGSTETWTIKLPSLVYAPRMFYSCPLEQFISDLPSLKEASDMFAYTSLERFSGSLPNLMHACDMFSNCKLDAQSVLHILNSIPTREDDPRVEFDWVYNEETDEVERKEIIHDRPVDENGDGVTKIGINCLDDEESKNQFAQEMGYDTWSEVVSAFIDEKKWFVDWQFNGEAPASYSLRGGNTISQPIWAKLREVEPKKDEKGKKLPFSYEYTSQDGKKFYHLDWFHESLGTTGYTQFDSLQAAEEHYGLIRKEKTTTTKKEEA